jgi:hypothetical protein
MKLSTKGDQNWTDVGRRLAFTTPAVVIEPPRAALRFAAWRQNPQRVTPLARLFRIGYETP